MEAFRAQKARGRGIAGGAREIFQAIRQMPPTMKQLAPVQMLTWLGLFWTWLYFPVAVARNVFGAPDQSSPLYQEGVEWADLCFAMCSVVTFVFSFFMPAIADKLGRRRTHAACLALGAAGLVSVTVIKAPWLLMLSMVGVGIAWASTLAMPCAMLAGSLPQERMGVYMGIFNFFIVLPEIQARLGCRSGRRGWTAPGDAAPPVLGGVHRAVRVAVLVVLAALAAPARGVPEESPPAPRANVAVLAGLFDFTDDTYRAGELGAQYRGRGRWWVLHPMAGGMVTTDGAWHLYAGFGIDIPLGRRFLIRLAFAPGYYEQGGGKPLGTALEFRSSFEIAWRFGEGWRIGLEGYHLSNADLAAHNPGNGSLLLALTIPLGQTP